MRKIKRFRPGKGKKRGTMFKPVKRTEGIPEAPAMPRPIQPKLDGFTTPELEELEGEIERFASVQDRVKEEKKKLTEQFDRAEAKLIEAMTKAKQDAIVIGGYTVQIVKTTKAKVKGNPPPKEETASRDHEDDEPETHGSETVEETADRLRRADPDSRDDTTIEISTRHGSVTVTPEQMKTLAKNAGEVLKEME